MNNLKAIEKTLKKLSVILTKKLTKQTELIKDLESKLACQTCQGKVQQILHGLGYNKLSHLCKEAGIIKHSIHVYTNYQIRDWETAERISYVIKEYFPQANIRIY